MTTAPAPTAATITKENLKFKGLIVGPPGVGKTTFAATAIEHPDMRDILFLNFEGGFLGLEKSVRDRVKKVDINTPEDLEATFWALINKDPRYAGIRTVIIDSGTEMQTMSLESAVRARIARDTKKGKTPKDGDEFSVDDIYQEDYGKDTARLKRLFRWFRDAPYHVIITALTKEVYSKSVAKGVEPKLEAVLPSFTAKLNESVRGYMDFVWYMFQDAEGNRGILTQERGAWKAKTRGPAFAAELTERVNLPVGEPHLANIYNRLLKAEASNNAK